jgi:hypothetical protein
VRGVVRRGETLSAGLLRCAHCGRKLHVAYSGTNGDVGGSDHEPVSPLEAGVKALRLSHALAQAGRTLKERDGGLSTLLRHQSLA